MNSYKKSYVRYVRHIAYITHPLFEWEDVYRIPLQDSEIKQDILVFLMGIVQDYNKTSDGCNDTYKYQNYFSSKTHHYAVVQCSGFSLQFLEHSDSLDDSLSLDDSESEDLLSLLVTYRFKLYNS